MRKLHRTHVMGVVALTAALGLAACGDDDDSGSSADTPTASFELTGSGKNPNMSGPETVEAGLVKVSFNNATKKEAVVQLVRIDGDQTTKQVLAAANAWGEGGKPLPDYIGLAGGSGNTKAGASQSVTQVLEPGRYLGVDINSNAATEFEVTGEAGDGELPEAEATIEAVDYSFNSSGLKAGRNTVTFSNTGKEPHFVVGLPIKPGKTIDDVKEFVESEKGEPPVEEEEGVFDSSLLDGGREQVIELDLKQGKYAFLCFIPDRAGGPPHVAKGMVAEATVE